MLKLTNISKIYNTNQEQTIALENINIEIQKSEFVSITGASGSGKTTLLKIIGGLEKPTKGNIFLENDQLDTFSPTQYTKYRLHNIGVVFQQPHLLPALNAWENVSFLLEIQGEKLKIAKEKAIHWLQKLGLDNKINAKVNELSGGQQQRVSIARALAINPKIILADEPTAHLDKENTQKLMDILLEINQNEKITILLNTHDPYIMQQISHNIMLENGKIMEK